VDLPPILDKLEGNKTARVVLSLLDLLSKVPGFRYVIYIVLNFRLQQCAGSHQSIKGLQ
jgi:hypothetical protein